MKSVFGKQERRWLYSKRYIRLKKAKEREANKKQADSHHRLEKAQDLDVCSISQGSNTW